MSPLANSTVLFGLISRNVYWFYLPSCIPRMFNVGFMLAFAMVIQVVSGIVLTILYSHTSLDDCYPSTLTMTTYTTLWLVRSVHIAGTSVVWALLYLHIVKALYSVSLSFGVSGIWYWGVVIYFATFVISFLGYVLPLSQMSYWGLIVFINVIGVVPVIGGSIVTLLYGGASVSFDTLHRICCLHVTLPWVMLGIMILHLMQLHWIMSTDITSLGTHSRDSALFTLWHMARDGLALVLLLVVYSYGIGILWWLVFHEESLQPYNMLATADKVIPEWFLLGFFAILKGIPDKLAGLALFIIIVALIAAGFHVTVSEGRLSMLNARVLTVWLVLMWWFMSNLAALVLLIGSRLLVCRLLLIFLVLMPL